MWLTDGWIHGLRRFGGEARHRVRFDSKLVCLIGANETGKSTVLDALEIARASKDFAQSDRTRGEQLPANREVVHLRYRLDDADRDALVRLACEGDPRQVQWFHVVRDASGEHSYWADPELMRDRTRRVAMRTTLAERSAQWWPPPPENSDAEDDDSQEPADGSGEPHWAPDAGRVSQLTEAMASDDSTLPDSAMAAQLMRELANEVEGRDETFAADLRALADVEEAQAPDEHADEILWSRVPPFVRFEDRARLLESEYDLNAADRSAGTALSNLLGLAGLDVDALLTAIGNGETGTVRDLREEANETLAKRMEVWQQDPPITVALENEGAILRIHVQSGTGPTMPFRERSDGLRQFVALVALTAHQPNPAPPILLIDEVETHLHYNAQADLIEVLTSQNAASQVVYTTHSAACLPQDLGLGVRVVEGVGEQTASVVRQNFWQDAHPGLGSLLMAMGASSLVYVTLRPAVIAEGGSDLILLPTLFREALGGQQIGFAIVPGASSTPPERIAGLDLQGVRTVWVLDADRDGRKRRGELADAGIDEERILLLTDDVDLEVEDLIFPDAYAQAVQLYVRDVGGADTFGVADLPSEPCRRHESVEAWCRERKLKPPSKIAIANKLIDQVGETALLDGQHAERLRELHTRVRDLLAHPNEDEPGNQDVQDDDADRDQAST